MSRRAIARGRAESCKWDSFRQPRAVDWRNAEPFISASGFLRLSSNSDHAGQAMTSSDIQRIETAIGRALSQAMREFYVNYPAELRATKASYEDDEGNVITECPADNELCDSADGLIALNDRRPGGNAALMEANQFILGAGECGETYWVDLDDATGSVQRFESGEDAKYSEDVAGSLAEFARVLIASYRNQ